MPNPTPDTSNHNNDTPYSKKQADIRITDTSDKELDNFIKQLLVDIRDRVINISEGKSELETYINHKLEETYNIKQLYKGVI